MCFEAPSSVVGTENEVTTSQASLLFSGSPVPSMSSLIMVVSINDLGSDRSSANCQKGCSVELVNWMDYLKNHLCTIGGQVPIFTGKYY